MRYHLLHFFSSCCVWGSWLQNVPDNLSPGCRARCARTLLPPSSPWRKHADLLVRRQQQRLLQQQQGRCEAARPAPLSPPLLWPAERDGGSRPRRQQFLKVLGLAVCLYHDVEPGAHLRKQQRQQMMMNTTTTMNMMTSSSSSSLFSSPFTGAAASSGAT
jgi:hypothetical protein